MAERPEECGRDGRVGSAADPAPPAAPSPAAAGRSASPSSSAHAPSPSPAAAGEGWGEGRSASPTRSATPLAPTLFGSARRFGCLLFLCALLLRLGAVLALDPGGVRFPDSRQYLEMVRNFDAGRGMVFEEERCGRVPGYPFLLWLLERGGADPVVAAKLLQAFLGAAVLLLFWDLGRRAFGETAGRLGALLVAVDPFQIFFTTLLLTESLLADLLVLELYLVVGALAAASSRRAVLLAAGAGAVNGLACLVHPTQLAFFGFLLPCVVLAAAPGRRRFAFAGWLLFALATAVVILPWTVRNYRVSDGAFVPLTARAGAALYEAFCPEADGGPVKDRIVWPSGLAGLDEVGRDRFLRGETARLIAADPGRALGLALRKLARFWNPVPNDAEFRTPFYCTVSLAYMLPLIIGGVAGLAACGRDLPRRALLLSPLLYSSAFSLFFVGSLRFRTPVLPFLAPFAGYGLYRIIAAIRRPGAG
ncbi:MAG: glycosyltransferase family 39 protein [Planctomycetes bacterium]|nr:glycosyltransferase family 39 protein [Planctomycetota bacterium]